jgi:hypothetical protein
LEIILTNELFPCLICIANELGKICICSSSRPSVPFIDFLPPESINLRVQGRQEFKRRCARAHFCVPRCKLIKLCFHTFIQISLHQRTLNRNERNLPVNYWQKLAARDCMRCYGNYLFDVQAASITSSYFAWSALSLCASKLPS